MHDDVVKIGDYVFSTLVAITESEHATGLMGKGWPPPIMIFPYKQASIHKFWMKNTPSPLDIIFCRDNRIISICYGEPYSTKLIGPNEPSNLVVEVPHGLARSCGLKIGDEIKPIYSLKTLGRAIKQGIVSEKG